MTNEQSSTAENNNHDIDNKNRAAEISLNTMNNTSHEVLDENHDESLMETYALGQNVEAQDDRYKDAKWYKGSVVEVDAKTGRVKVHFNGFHKKWDLWKSVTSETLRKSTKPAAKRSSRTSVPGGGTPRKSATPVKEQKPPVIHNKVMPVQTTTPTKTRAVLKPETPISPSASTRRSISMQTPVIKNPAEASPPPVQTAPANLDENNATTLAPAFFRTRKVMVDSVISTNSVEIEPVQSPKKAKMSPHRPGGSMTPNSVEESISNQRQPRRSSSLNRQAPSSSPLVESAHVQNDTTQVPPTTKRAPYIRKTSNNDRELVEKMFGGLVAIENDGLLKCKVPGCMMTAHNPHMMMFHLDIEHPVEFKKTSIRIVIPSKQTKYQARTVHKGSLVQLDISVNCLCKSTAATGFLLRCSLCEKWQHGNCIYLSETNPPSTYLCFECILKPDSAADSYKPVYVTTINENVSSNQQESLSHPAKEVPTFVNAFAIGHSIDSYRNMLSKLKKQMDTTNFTDSNVDAIMGEFKSMLQILADDNNTKLDFQKLSKSFDNAILKI